MALRSPQRGTQRNGHRSPTAGTGTAIWEDSTGGAWFTVDQPSTQFGSLGLPEVSNVGVELDRRLAALLEALDVDVPEALLQG